MTIIFEEKNKEYHILVCEIFENHEELFPKIKDELSKVEIERFYNFKNNKRKAEWLGVRLTLKTMLGKYYEILYRNTGSPYINFHKNISISHSNGIIGVIISNKKEIGLDVEVLNNKILRTAHKFITKKEIESFTDKDKLKKIYLNWCCKETLFKIKEHGGYDFKLHFKVIDAELREKGIKNAVISYNNKIEYFYLNYEFIKYDTKEVLIVWH